MSNKKQNLSNKKMPTASQMILTILSHHPQKKAKNKSQIKSSKKKKPEEKENVKSTPNKLSEAKKEVVLYEKNKNEDSHQLVIQPTQNNYKYMQEQNPVECLLVQISPTAQLHSNAKVKNPKKLLKVTFL